MTRVGILGLGRVAEEIHLPACAALPGIDVVAGCDPRRERRDRMRDRYRIPALYEDAEQVFVREKPDVAIIGSPPDSHRDLCLLALEHGAHVFCEKPFVSSVSEADEVVAAAERKGLHVAVNNQYRHMKIYRTAQRRLERGDFGPLFFIQCWQQMNHPPSNEANWRAQLLQSTLFEFGTHALDLLCFFFGSLPLSVSAHMPGPRRDVMADVIVQMTLRFPDDRLATLAFNRISHAPQRYLEMRLDCERASLRISLGGVARASVDWSSRLGLPSARFSLVRGGEARLESGGRSRVIAREWRKPFATATAENLRQFLAALNQGGGANGRPHHARELIRIVFAGYESARTGETVWLS